MTLWQRYPSLPYVLPFAALLFFLAVQAIKPLPERFEFPVRIVILGAVLWYCSRDVISLRVSHRAGSLLLGIAVFAAWVGPDLLFPGYREHWLFQNAITGTLRSSLTESGREDAFVLALRSVRAIVLVPVIEELFWRAWLMRWLINADFRKVALGTFSVMSFALTAFLFSSEHGPYWDVGLLAGVAYNWWMVHTRSLGDCILAHAVTNGCLSLFVLVTGKWEYWL
jgi:CAAX prenyl protease-like protein